MIGEKKQVKEKYAYNKAQLIEFLEKIKNELMAGAVTIGNERVQLPEGSMSVDYEYKSESGESEIEIEIKWRGQTA
jgi:amphi-Trp domain-containing protein